MSNDEKEKEAKVEAPKIETADWNSDFFPVSAKPVWIKLGMIFFGVIILGLIAIYYSADEEEEKPKEPKKQTEDIFTQDEEEK